MYALVDCNNFYASCERVFNPSLNNKPVLVLSNNDGCVIARSNEAKSLGIKMGEPAFKLRSFIRNNKVYTFSTNFALYGDMSQRVMNTLSHIIPNIEIYSIDEAFLDLNDFNHKDLNNFAFYIRNKILKDVGLPVSVGVGRTKTLAKIANHIAKKSKKEKGVYILDEQFEEVVLDRINIDKIWGVGRKLELFLNNYGVKTAKDLRNVNLKWIQKKINITAEKMVKELRGTPCMKIQIAGKDKQSICTSRTFGTMVSNKKDIESSLAMYGVRCAEKLRLQQSCASILHVFISTNPFRKDLKQYSNSMMSRFTVATNDTGEIIKYIRSIFDKIYKSGYQYKRAGVILSGIIPEYQVQENLFDEVDRFKSKKIMNTIDGINKKMGRDVIRYAIQGYSKKWKLKQQCLSPCYTTRWKDLLTINMDN